MSYNYRQGGTPDHVDSSQSNSKYPHVGIPIPAQKTDATKVAMPSPDLPQKIATRDSLQKDYKSKADNLSSTLGHSGSYSPLEVLGMATDGDSDAKGMLRDATTEIPKAKAAIDAASKRQSKYSK